MLKHIHDRSLLFGQVLGIMVIITLISISFFGLYSVRSAADQMGQGKDVVADILPPPLYLIESQLQVYTLLHAKPEEREALLQTLTRLQQEFESRNRFWQESNLNEPLRKLLLGEQKVRGGAVLAVAQRQVCPRHQGWGSGAGGRDCGAPAHPL
ncbi:hypothetical protein [Aeromonas veronii]|uniref:hypothetical protein n=1 Tax=Aeromonas veronii TaxID=654 RepID=UPI002444588B|nr:hypothetical protein [Aeromonas veronii]